MALLITFVLLLMLPLAFSNTMTSRVGKNSKRLFEGDIQPVFSQLELLYGSNLTHLLMTNGVLPKQDDETDMLALTSLASKHHGPALLQHFPIWPNPRNSDGVVEIPYFFEKSFVGNKEKVQLAMETLARKTGVVNFRKVYRSDALSSEGPTLRIAFSNPAIREEVLSYYPPCWSYVGYQPKNGPIQDVNLGPGCLDEDMQDLVTHLLLHTLGLWHMNSRWDRDDYVTIHWSNIYPGLEYNFFKRILDDSLGAPYDYFTIMHAGPTEGSGDDSIVTEAPVSIGQLEGPSKGDILRVRLLYQCHSGPRNFSDYMAHRCTPDCPCWKGAKGCGGVDEACQGSLICEASSNRCTFSHSKDDNGRHEMPHKMLVVVAMAGLIVAGAFIIKRLCHRTRQGYQTLPSENRRIIV